MLLLHTLPILASLTAENILGERLGLSEQAFSPLELCTPEIESVIRIVIGQANGLDEGVKRRVEERLEELEGKVGEITGEEKSVVGRMVGESKTCLEAAFFERCRELASESVKEHDSEKSTNESVKEHDSKKSTSESVMKDFKRLEDAFRKHAACYFEEKEKKYANLIEEKNGKICRVLKEVVDDTGKIDSVTLTFDLATPGDVEASTHDCAEFVRSVEEEIDATAGEVLHKAFPSLTGENKDVERVHAEYVGCMACQLKAEFRQQLREVNAQECRSVSRVVGEGNIKIRNLVLPEMERLYDTLKQMISAFTAEGIESVTKKLRSINKEFIKRLLPDYRE